MAQSCIAQAGWPTNASGRSGNLNIVLDTLIKANLAVIKATDDYLFQHSETCRKPDMHQSCYLGINATVGPGNIENS